MTRDRMTLDQALFQRDGYQQAYEQCRQDLADARAELAQLRDGGQRLIDALREHGDPVGDAGHVWGALWALHEAIHHDGLGKP